MSYVVVYFRFNMQNVLQMDILHNQEKEENCAKDKSLLVAQAT